MPVPIPPGSFSIECSTRPAAAQTPCYRSSYNIPRTLHRERGGPLERNQEYDEKFLRIVDTARGIFAEKGYHHASVRDVAAATGVSPAGLYYYFQSKEELLYLILEACLSSLLDRIQEEIADLEDPSSRLRSIVHTHLAHLERHGKAMKVLVHEWESLSGAFHEEISELMQRYVQLVIQVFRDLSPGKGPRELRAAAFGLLSMLSWVDQWHRPEQDLPLDLLAEEYSNLVLAGLLSRPRSVIDTGSPDEKETDRKWAEPNSTSSILSGPGF